MKKCKVRLSRRNFGFDQRAELDVLKGRYEDGKKRVMIISNDSARLILVPETRQTASDSKLLHHSNYEKFLDIAARPTMEEKAEYMRKMKEDNDTREREMEKQIKHIGLDPYKPKLTKQETKLKEENQLRNKHIRQRAKAMRLEDEEVMKLLNSEIAKAKCEVIIKKQMEQRVMREKIKKDLDEKQAREMIEESEALFYKTKARDEEIKKEKEKKMVEFLEKQVKVKEMKRALEKEQSEKEDIQRKIKMNEELKEELETMHKLEKDKNNLLKLQQNLITEKLKMKLKEKEEENEINKNAEIFLDQKNENDKIAKDRVRKQWETRSKAQEAVIKQKKEQDKLKSEAEEFEMKRNENKRDREWRKKEKERILKEMEAKKRFHEAIAMQIQGKYQQKTKEILMNLQEAEQIKKKLVELDTEFEIYNKKINEEKNKFIADIAQQAKEKKREEHRQRVEDEIFLETLKDIEEQRKDNLKKAIENKIDELKSYESINDSVIQVLKQKAEKLKTKI